MSILWTHIAMSVSDIERTVDFYTSFCDLTVVRDRRREGGTTVWLGPQPPPGEDPTFLLVIYEGEEDIRIGHFGFQCESREQVDQMAEKGRALGILVSPSTDSGGSVGYWCELRDPDGHVVEFTYGQKVKGVR